MATNSAPERANAMACVLTERACALTSANCTERRRIGSGIQQWTRSHFDDNSEINVVPINFKQLCARPGIVDVLHAALDQVDRPYQGGMMPRLSRWQLSHIRTSHMIHGDKPAWAGAPQAMTATTAARVINTMQPQQKAHVFDMYTEMLSGHIGPSTRRRLNKQIAEYILAVWQRQLETRHLESASVGLDVINPEELIVPIPDTVRVSAHRVIPLWLYRKRKRESEITLTSIDNNCRKINYQSTFRNNFELSLRTDNEQYIISSAPTDDKNPVPVLKCIHTVCDKDGSEQTSKCAEAATGTCSVCMDNPSNVLFLPCQHCCCCIECIKELEKCPLCRQPIVDSHKIYF